MPYTEHKGEFERLGTVKKIGIDGLGVYTPINKKNAEEQKIALRAEVGDEIVKVKAMGKYRVIKKADWDILPKDEKELKEFNAKEIGIDTAAQTKEIAGLRAEVEELRKQIAAQTTQGKLV